MKTILFFLIAIFLGKKGILQYYIFIYIFIYFSILLVFVIFHLLLRSRPLSFFERSQNIELVLVMEQSQNTLVPLFQTS